MRFLLKVNIPVESGNAAAKAGKLGATIQRILSELQPEAVYFTDDGGQRTPGSFFWRCKTLLKSPQLPNHGSLRSMQRLKFIQS